MAGPRFGFFTAAKLRQWVAEEVAAAHLLLRDLDQIDATAKLWSGAASARAFGDNDANRKVRSKLNDELVELGKAYADHTTRGALEVRQSAAGSRATREADGSGRG
ncbi:MAG: hypothetical protein WCD52_04885 [Xanthobacteraceae bacterium]